MTFNVVAAGSEPLAYQWYAGSTPVAGATSPALTLSNLQTSDAGNYSVTVSNEVGTATSASAALTVNTPTSGACYRFRRRRR